MLTTRVKIGTIQKSSNQSAQGRYWAVDQKSNATFFGTVGDVRKQFRNTQSPQANIQFDEDGGVYITIPAAFGLGFFGSETGITLTGGTVSTWAAQGGLYATAGLANLPVYTEQDPDFNGLASLALDNSVRENSLVANSVAKATDGLNMFGVELVANTALPGGPAYAVGNVEVYPNAAGQVVASVGLARAFFTLAASELTQSPHTILVTGDGSNIYLYFDGTLKAQAAQTSPISGLTGKFGAQVLFGTGFNGKLAKVQIANAAITAAQAKSQARANANIYVKRQ